MATEITEVELLEALRVALEEHGDDSTPGLSTEEIADAMKCCQPTVRKVLKPLVRSGKIVPQRGRRIGIDGVMRPVPVYQLVQESEAESE
jgi:predicted ArsR family transcriptional regulator